LTTHPRSSPLATFSTGYNTWIAPIEIGLVVEELKEKDEKDEEDEGLKGQGEGGSKEEEVRRDKEFITNILKDEESSS